MNYVALKTAALHDYGNDARPVIVASQCLGFAAVRYNGAIIDAPFVQRLATVADIIEVCPEVAIGLGVPRPPIRMQREGDAIALVQPSTGRDITRDMSAYADGFLRDLNVVDGFILKARSPSCGIDGVNVYEGEGTDVTTTAPGRFAAAVMQHFGDVAIEDELRLRGHLEREHFLTRVFASARLRRATETGTRAALVAFHTRCKYLLMAYSPGKATALGRIVAANRPAAESFIEYGTLMRRALSRPAAAGTFVNALMHMAGHVSGSLSREEREDLTTVVAGAAGSLEGRLAALEHVRRLTREHEDPYLAGQAIFDPFPAHLMEDGVGGAPDQGV